MGRCARLVASSACPVARVCCRARTASRPAGKLCACSSEDGCFMLASASARGVYVGISRCSGSLSPCTKQGAISPRRIGLWGPAPRLLRRAVLFGSHLAGGMDNQPEDAIARLEDGGLGDEVRAAAVRVLCATRGAQRVDTACPARRRMALMIAGRGTRRCSGTPTARMRPRSRPATARSPRSPHASARSCRIRCPPAQLAPCAAAAHAAA